MGEWDVIQETPMDSSSSAPQDEWGVVKQEPLATTLEDQALVGQRAFESTTNLGEQSRAYDESHPTFLRDAVQRIKTAGQVAANLGMGAVSFPLGLAAGAGALVAGEGMEGFKKRQAKVGEFFTPNVGELTPEAQAALETVGTITGAPSKYLGAGAAAVFGEGARPYGEVAGDALLMLAPLIPKAVRVFRGSEWYRGMTIPERGMVAQSLDDMIKRGYSEGDILRKWNNPTYRADALARRMQPEPPSGPTGEPFGPEPGVMPPGTPIAGQRALPEPIDPYRTRGPEVGTLAGETAPYSPELATGIQQTGRPALPEGQGFEMVGPSYPFRQPPPSFVPGVPGGPRIGDLPPVATTTPVSTPLPYPAQTVRPDLPLERGTELQNKGWEIIKQEPLSLLAPSMTPPPASGASGGTPAGPGTAPPRPGAVQPPSAPGQPIQPWEMTKKEFIANPPKGFQYKEGRGYAAQRGEGITNLSDSFFNLDIPERKDLINHEIGHDLVRNFNKDFKDVFVPLKKGLGKDSYGQIREIYDNPFGFRENPEEIIADTYSSLFEPRVYEDGKFDVLRHRVAEVAIKKGLPVPPQTMIEYPDLVKPNPARRMGDAEVYKFHSDKAASDYITSRRMLKDDTLFEKIVDSKTGEVIVRNQNWLRREPGVRPVGQKNRIGDLTARPVPTARETQKTLEPDTAAKEPANIFQKDLVPERRQPGRLSQAEWNKTVKESGPEIARAKAAAENERELKIREKPPTARETQKTYPSPEALKAEGEKYGAKYKGPWMDEGKVLFQTFTDGITGSDFALLPSDDLKATILRHRQKFVDAGNIPANALNLGLVKEPLIPRIIPHPGAGLRIEYLQSGKVVGTGQLLRKEIPSIHVTEEYRRQGIGQEIMKDLISRGGKSGYPATEAGKRLMAKAGMEDIGGAQYGFPSERASVPFMLTNEIRNNLKDKGLTDDIISNLKPAQAHEMFSGPKPTPETPFPKPGPLETKTILERLKTLNEDLGQSGSVDLSGAIDYIEKTKKEVKYSGSLQDDYYRLRNQSEIDRILTKKFLEEAKGKPADYEAIYNWIENPKEPLTAAQKQLYNTEIEPVRKERNRLFSKLRNDGIPVEGAGYVPRFVAERGGFFDRLIEGMRTSNAGAGILRKTAQSFKHRVMKVIEDEQGNRKVVAIKGGVVTGFKEKEPGEILGRTQEATPKRTEWFDKQVMEKLNTLVKDLGIKHERVVGGKGLGGNRLGASVPGGIKTKHATPEDVILHEIGHQLDDRYDINKLFFGGHDKKGVKMRVILKKEIRALADLRYEGQNVSNYYKKYVRKGEEKAAVMFQGYLHAPEAFRSVAPNVYQKFVDFLRTHPETKPILEIKPSLVYGKATLGGPVDSSKFIDKSGKKWTIGEATTKEIEAATKLKYHKNALLNEAITYNELKKVDRAISYLEALTTDPEFLKVAIKLGTQNIPHGYKTTVLPQLRGYAFPDRMAETFDTFYKHVSQGIMEPSSVYAQVNRVLRNAIFFNPLIHIPNITVHALVNRGTVALLNPGAYPRGIRAGVRAIRATLAMNQDYMDALDKGAGLLYSGVENKNLYEIMLKKMSAELEGNQPLLAKIGQALGYANPDRLVKAIYRFSSQATWAVNDFATLQSVFEEMARGKSMEEAITGTAKHIPNYRIPPRVMNSTTISKLMRPDSGITMFGAYHYGALKSYGEMAKSFLGKVPLAERASALDKLAMLGITIFLIYPLLDEIARELTGNKNIGFRRAGAATFPYKTWQMAKGKITFPAWVQSVLTPSIGLSMGVSLLMGRDPRTGRAMPPGEIALNALAPISQVKRLYEGRTPPSEALESLIGISKIRPEVSHAKRGGAVRSIPEQSSTEKFFGIRQPRQRIKRGG